MTNTTTIPCRVIDYRFVLTIIVFFFSSTLFSQNFEFSGSFRMARELAENAEEEGDLYAAIEYYEYYIKRKDNQAVKYKLALLYYQIKDYNRAQVYFKEIANRNIKKYPLSQFYQAEILRIQGQYILAKKTYVDFNNLYKNGKEKKKYLKLSKMAMLGCDYSLRVKDSISEALVSRLDTSINSRHIEQSPSIFDSLTMVYSTTKINELVYYRNKENKNHYKRRMAIAKLNQNQWEFDRFLMLENDSLTDFVNPVLSPYKGRVYFNKCHKTITNKHICHLYVGTYKNGQIVNVEKLPETINLSNYTSTSPSVFYDPETKSEIVYFASDRPKGKGGMDIWLTVFSVSKNKFSNPSNVGNQINTIGNEITPFFDEQSGSLYFSSDALPGLGGLDIFKSMGNRKSWTTPVNISQPINSSFDDLYYSIDDSQKNGFLTSNRPGGESLRSSTCCDDIFKFTYDGKRNFDFVAKLSVRNRNDIDILLKEFLGTYDEKSMLINSEINLFVIDPKTKDTIFIKSFRPDSLGQINIPLEKNAEYKLAVSNSNINPVSILVNTSKNDISKQPVIDYGKIEIEAVPSEYQKINLRYEFNDASLTPEMKQSLDTLYLILSKLPQLNLSIHSHTDNKGTEEYNQKLSQKRADVIKAYITGKGIAKSRIEAIGFGETQPIVGNENADGSDNPDGRAQNRRTEIKFLKLEQNKEAL